MPEEKIQGGYILLSRKLLTSGIMDKPPLWFKLFTWMLLKANKKKGYNGLDIGQFRTTAREMQEAMTYFVGYRKQTPTPKEIRVVYEGLSKGKAEGKAKGIDQMIEIDTMKGKRGMVVTILNYARYQDPGSYEGHSKKSTKEQHEGQSEKFTKAEVRAKLISLQEEYNKNNKNKYIYTDMPDFVTEFIFYIQEQKSKFAPSLTKTLIESSFKTIVDLIRLDGFDWEYIKSVIRWAKRDVDFWADNLQSLATLRKKSKSNSLKKFQNIAKSYESSRSPGRFNGNGYSRSEQNAMACQDFINDMMQECENE